MEIDLTDVRAELAAIASELNRHNELLKQQVEIMQKDFDLRNDPQLMASKLRDALTAGVMPEPRRKG